LWNLGLGVADGMDTAQRGGGLTWLHTRELIDRSGAEASACGGALAFGASTDQLNPHTTHRPPPRTRRLGWSRCVAMLYGTTLDRDLRLASVELSGIS